MWGDRELLPGAGPRQSPPPGPGRRQAFFAAPAKRACARSPGGRHRWLDRALWLVRIQPPPLSDFPDPAACVPSRGGSRLPGSEPALARAEIANFPAQAPRLRKKIAETRHNPLALRL